MIEEQAIVIGTKGTYVEIQMQRQSACGHCELSHGCGTSAIGRMLGHRNKALLIENTLNLKSGDHILLGMPDSSLLKASLLIYGLPLVLLIVAAILAQIASDGSEILVLASAGTGFSGGLMISTKLAGKRFAGQFKPRILQVNNEPTEQF